MNSGQDSHAWGRPSQTLRFGVTGKPVVRGAGSPEVKNLKKGSASIHLNIPNKPVNYGILCGALAC